MLQCRRSRMKRYMQVGVLDRVLKTKKRRLILQASEGECWKARQTANLALARGQMPVEFWSGQWKVWCYSRIDRLLRKIAIRASGQILNWQPGQGCYTLDNRKVGGGRGGGGDTETYNIIYRRAG